MALCGLPERPRGRDHGGGRGFTPHRFLIYPDTAMLPEILISSLLFFVSHSLLASRRAKDWARRRFGVDARVYRLGYVVIALVSTLAWTAYIHALPDRPLYALDGPAAWGLRAVQAVGVGMLVLSVLPIDGLAFLGLRRRPGPLDDFVEAGIYRCLRHPMYAGAVLVLLASPVQTVNGLAFYLLASAYMLVGARFEEARLMADCPAYDDYRRRVPAFVPRPSCLFGRRPGD